MEGREGSGIISLAATSGISTGMEMGASEDVDKSVA